MRNFFNSAAGRVGMTMAAVSAVIFGAAAPSFAVDATPSEIATTAITGAKTDLLAVLSGNVALIATVFAAFLGVSIVFRWLRRVAK